MYIRRRGQWCGTEVRCGVVDSGDGECFTTLDAGSAGSTMRVSAFVAGPSGGEIDSEFESALCDGSFGEVDEGADDADARVSSALHGSVHRLHKLFATIWVDSVVA